jgi:hypothetical protein
MDISCLRAIFWDKEGELLEICEQRGQSYSDFVGEILDTIDNLEDTENPAYLLTIKEIGHLKEGTREFDIEALRQKSRVSILTLMYDALAPYASSDE